MDSKATISARLESIPCLPISDQHHQPNDWATLRAHNELELYDTAADPHEVNNLANHAEDHQELILDLNDRLNKLIDAEIGIDDGSYYSSRRNYSLKP